MATTDQTRREPVDGFLAKAGAIYGVIAFVGGYVVTYVLLEIDDKADLNEMGEASNEFGISQMDIVGWTFYNAHFVDTEFSASGNGQSVSETGNLLSEVSLQFPDFLYHLVPILALVGAAYYLVKRSQGTSHGGPLGPKAGASIVVGYLPLAVVGAFFFSPSGSRTTISGEVSYSMGPEITTAVIFAGIAFPLLFGAIGGQLSSGD